MISKTKNKNNIDKRQTKKIKKLTKRVNQLSIQRPLKVQTQPKQPFRLAINKIPVQSDFSKCLSPAGYAYLMKASDPAHVYEGYCGIPDDDFRPKVIFKSQSQFQVSAPSNSVGKWDANIYLNQHPYMLGGIYATDTDSVHSAETVLLNPMVNGDDSTEKTLWWCQNVKEYRLAYAYATVELVCNALSNEGSLTATQFDWSYSKGNINLPASGLTNEVITKMLYIINDDDPTWDKMVASPRRYTGQAVDGAYVPFKLSDKSRSWHISNPVQYVYNSLETALDYDDPWVTVTGLTDTSAPPYICDNPLRYDTAVRNGKTMVPPVSPSVAKIYLKDLNLTAAVRITIESAYELISKPGSQFSSFIDEPPLPDDKALEMYQMVSQICDDAYPAAMNDFGKMIRKIGSIASKVWKLIAKPAINAILPGGELITTGVDSVIQGLGKIKLK